MMTMIIIHGTDPITSPFLLCSPQPLQGQGSKAVEGMLALRETTKICLTIYFTFTITAENISATLAQQLHHVLRPQPNLMASLIIFLHSTNQFSSHFFLYIPRSSAFCLPEECQNPSPKTCATREFVLNIYIKQACVNRVQKENCIFAILMVYRRCFQTVACVTPGLHGTSACLFPSPFGVLFPWTQSKESANEASERVRRSLQHSSPFRFFHNPPWKICERRYHKCQPQSQLRLYQPPSQRPFSLLPECPIMPREWPLLISEVSQDLARPRSCKTEKRAGTKSM